MEPDATGPPFMAFMALFDAEGQELARLKYENDLWLQDKMMWQSVNRGYYYIVVGNGEITAVFALTVTVR